ncbi:4'-phosphopantetheinyl transferase superfamily protein [Zooshikella marina]|uniref:4'-phosphopantetheinyl transferase family protein n=1 Tax=Zooshikella ganghwensis TaxID=202772 RepID=UPI001BB02762|nr:4'-phosphopantetheinyl transferase superfamily protein [Zooshikella ganghwensis]MBU2708323.1 4'-phosphopantetheinyl transferase superfamily protein [Zooshikella ganghwensis]
MLKERHKPEDNASLTRAAALAMIGADQSVKFTGLIPNSTTSTLFSGGCHYKVQDVYLSAFSQLGITLPDGLNKAVLKRQIEFMAGRYSAQQALYTLGFKQPVMIPINSDRSPCWPAGIIGSITHSEHIALAVVANSKYVTALGVDLEKEITLSVARDIAKQIISLTEQNNCAKWGCPFNWFLTLAFSAKESLYKAIYPHINQFFGFDAAELIALNTVEQSFLLQLTQSLSENYQAGDCFQGTYTYQNGFICTLIMCVKNS